MRKPELYYRDPDLVITLIAHLETSDHPIPWNDLVATCPDRDYRGVERTIRALAELGAAHITGRYTHRDDTRRIRLTPLGIAWLDRDQLPHVDDEHDWTTVDNDTDELTG